MLILSLELGMASKSDNVPSSCFLLKAIFAGTVLYYALIGSLC